MRQADDRHRVLEQSLAEAAEEVSLNPTLAVSVLWSNGRNQEYLQPCLYGAQKLGGQALPRGLGEALEALLCPYHLLNWSRSLLSTAGTGAKLLGSPPESSCNAEYTVCAKAEPTEFCTRLWEEAQSQSEKHVTGKMWR